jgi:hypothetical protein
MGYDLINGWNLISPQDVSMSSYDLIQEINNNSNNSSNNISYRKNSIWTLTNIWDASINSDLNWTNITYEYYLSPYQGYWIYIIDLVAVEETTAAAVTPLTHDNSLSIGWNIISIPSDGSYNMIQALDKFYALVEPTHSSFTITILENSIWYSDNGWDSSTDNESNLLSLNVDDILNPYLGYWVKITDISYSTI